MQAKELLAEIRSAGMTQAEVSEKTGIPQPTISKIERGAVDDVMSRSYIALQKLQRAIRATHIAGRNTEGSATRKALKQTAKEASHG